MTLWELVWEVLVLRWWRLVCWAEGRRLGVWDMAWRGRDALHDFY